MTVSLCGSASIDYADRLESALANAAPCPEVVCLDLREVDYVDCAALSALHKFAENRKRIGFVTTSALSAAASAALQREKLTCLT